MKEKRNVDNHGELSAQCGYPMAGSVRPPPDWGTEIIKNNLKKTTAKVWFFFVPKQSSNNTSSCSTTPQSRITAAWKRMCCPYAIYNHYKEQETDDNEFYLPGEWHTYESLSQRPLCKSLLSILKQESDAHNNETRCVCRRQRSPAAPHRPVNCDVSQLGFWVKALLHLKHLVAQHQFKINIEQHYN